MIPPIPDYDKYMAGPEPESRRFYNRKSRNYDEDQAREDNRLRSEEPYAKAEDRADGEENET